MKEATQLKPSSEETTPSLKKHGKISFKQWCIDNNRQDLLEEWDYENNKGQKPEDFTHGNAKKVWWVKPYDDPITGKHFDFRWKASINKRVIGRGCPYLAVPTKSIMPGFNDLATTHPELAKDWAYEQNLKELGLEPTTISYGSTTEVFWNCEKHGLYKMGVAARARGYGCPYCAGKRIKVGQNDLRTARPDIAAEWDTERNGRGPEKVTIGCTKPVWWKCKYGHSWKSTPNARTSQNTGCPICSGRKVLEGFNDLATKSPKMADEWDYEKNAPLKPNQVTAHSNKKVWWKCAAGHRFKAAICTRVEYQTRCPICNRERKISFAEKTILFYLKKCFEKVDDNVRFPWLGKREIDIYLPEAKIGIEYDGGHWHQEPKKDRGKDVLCQEHGITMIRIREESCPKYEGPAKVIICHSNRNTNGLKGANEQLLSTIAKLTNKTIPIDIDIDRDNALILENCLTAPKSNNLAVRRPDLLEQWDYEKNVGIKPEYVSEFSNRKIWWKCPKCHQSYLMKVVDRTGEKQSNCPICAGKRIVVGINDFASRHPDLLNEWDYERNTISPQAIVSSSKKKIWWKCPNGHNYQTSVYSRTGLHTNCPYCAHQKSDGTNGFPVSYPELLEEWDYERNSVDPYSVLPFSNKKYHWICKTCGYKWQATLTGRTREHKGCPLCAHQVLVPGINDLATQYPEIAMEWNYERNTLKPSEVSGGTNKKYWWKCKVCGHEWECVVASRTKRHSDCPICRKKQKSKNTD